MGIPKFYRWISERYPCLSQVIAQQQIPDFDNLYLDMNGIIHTCTHPNDDDPHFRLSEEAMFNDIFHYIEVLFRIIKPQKVFFMAVDGVAPRAKMNQQRGRRFRSAQEAQAVINKAVSRGQVMPSEARFDSNCITPGTEFMWKLQKQLKYFVHKKTTTDPLWQQVKVVLSGQDVPGEGEHKIMEFIRYQKTQPDYDPNTRHCLYGLDADLIMLGLVSHERYFALLREEVKFGRKASKTSDPDATTFHLLHISLLREYIDMDFSVVKDKLPFAYDLDRIIDDWVLMEFLIGNDFIPHLPNFHIHQDTLPYIYEKYQKVLPTLSGYINNCGILDLVRFEMFLQSLSSFDTEYLTGQVGDLRWLEGKTGKKETKEEDPAVLEKLMRDLGVHDLESYFDDDDEEEQIDGGLLPEIAQIKEAYYKDKFGFASVDKDVLNELATCYVVAIEWILRYYYTGAPSWSWFYPYHYAPYVSDLKDFSNINIKFELGVPFQPFQQLLAVLPPASKQLLPAAYQPLMTDEHSPILDFYPLDFSIDLNGKRQEWEAVVLIPFIDEERLIQAMEGKKDKLTAGELQLNAIGSTLVMKFDSDAKPYTYPSSLEGKFPDIMKCQTRCEELKADHYSDCDVTAKDGTDSGSPQWIAQGFPTFRHLSFVSQLQQCGVKVFQVASRTNNMCLTLTQPSSEELPALKEVAEKLIGKTCYVDWPFLVEALVISVSDVNGKVVSGQAPISIQHHSERESKAWKEWCTTISQEYINRRGITINDIAILVEAKKLVGTRCVSIKSGPKGALHLEKQWSSSSNFHPYQTIVMGIRDSEETSPSQMTLETVYHKGMQCVLLSSQYYGSLAEIVSVDMETDRIHVRVKPHMDVDFSSIYGNWKLTDFYFSSQEVCNKLHLSNLLLSRISSSCSCEQRGNGRRKEIGLCFKYSKRQLELPGYCKLFDNIWMYSKQALDILKAYVKKFPIMFRQLNANPNENIFNEDALFPPDSSEKLSEVEVWLKALPTNGLQPIKCGSLSLDTPQVAAVERLVAEQQNNITKTFKLRVKPWTLYKPSVVQSGVLVDKQANHELLDRVMNVSLYHPMKFGLTGTITGIRPTEDGSNYQYEIVFDEPFTGGHKWRCGAGKGYCLGASSFVNISYGKRLEASKKGGRRSLPANLLPQGTAYQMDHVDYGHSPRAYNRANQKSEKSPKQNYSSEKTPKQNYSLEKSPKQNYSKKVEKQSYDKVQVRLLKRPNDKTDKATSPGSKGLNHVNIVTSVPPVTPTKQELLTATPTAHTNNLSPSVAAVFAAAAAASSPSQIKTPPGNITATPTFRPAPPTLGSFSPPVQAMLSGRYQPPQAWRPTFYTPPRNFPSMPPAGMLPNYWSGAPPPFNPGPRHPNGPQVNPIAELQHVAGIYGYQPVKVYTQRDTQGLYTGVVELPGLGMYRGTPSTDEYMAKCSAAAVAMAMLRQPLLPGPMGFPAGASPQVSPFTPQYFQTSPQIQRPPVSSVQPSFIPLQVQKKKWVDSQDQKDKPTQEVVTSLFNHDESKASVSENSLDILNPHDTSNTDKASVEEPLPSQVAN